MFQSRKDVAAHSELYSCMITNESQREDKLQERSWRLETG
jgi:uncharacterized protein YecT (DUF1311 family)